MAPLYDAVVTVLQTGLALPTLYRPHAVAAPFEAAQDAVADGAGWLGWCAAGPVWEAAVVLEPDLPRPAARLALLAGLVALADSLALVAPPEKPLTLGFPDRLLLDGALTGAVKLQAAAGDAEGPPDWMVLGARLRVLGRPDPGLTPDLTSLGEEGFEPTDPVHLTEGWARHLMATLADWQDGGLRALADRLLPRLPAEPGICRALDADGALRCTPGTLTPLRSTDAWGRLA